MLKLIIVALKSIKAREPPELKSEYSPKQWPSRIWAGVEEKKERQNLEWT